MVELDGVEDMRFNFARLFRDANVLSIWEGTTDIMADDMLKVLKGRSGQRVMTVLSDWVKAMLPSSGGTSSIMHTERGVVGSAWTSWAQDIDAATTEELQVRGRDVMARLGRIVCAVLLVIDASRDKDTAAIEAVRRWMQSMSPEEGPKGHWKDAVRLDRIMVFGSETKEMSRL